MGGTLDMTMAASKVLETSVESVRAWRWLNSLWSLGSQAYTVEEYEKAAEVAQEAHEALEEAVDNYVELVGD